MEDVEELIIVFLTVCAIIAGLGAIILACYVGAGYASCMPMMFVCMGGCAACGVTAAICKLDY